MARVMGLGIKTRSIPDDEVSFARGFTLNTGNLLFHFAAQMIATVNPNPLPWSGISHGEDDKGTVLLPMANHIGKHVNLSERGPKIEKVDSNIAVIGLGAQFGLSGYSLKDVPEGTNKWLEILSTKGINRNIAVRGEYTAEILTKMGFGDKVIATGCPSLLINHQPNLGERISKKFTRSTLLEKKNNLTIAAGSPFQKGREDLERSLIGLVDGFGAKYIVQNPFSLISLASGWDHEMNERELKIINERWFPNLESDGMKRWFKKNARVYISVPQWIYDLSSADFCVGTRIHGVQAAIQAGTPAVCIYHDSRTKELCEFMKIPKVSIDDLSIGPSVMDQLFDVFRDWDGEEFDQNRSMLSRRTKEFLEQNAIKPTKHLNFLAGV